MAETKNLVERLTRQLAAKGNTGAKSMAIGILKKRGQLGADGELTKLGKERQSLGAAGRAKDRASKASGKAADSFTYDPKTNSTKLKRS